MWRVGFFAFSPFTFHFPQGFQQPFLRESFGFSSEALREFPKKTRRKPGDDTAKTPGKSEWLMAGLSVSCTETTLQV